MEKQIIKPERGDIGDPGSEGIYWKGDALIGAWPPGGVAPFLWPENDDGN